MRLKFSSTLSEVGFVQIKLPLGYQLIALSMRMETAETVFCFYYRTPILGISKACGGKVLFLGGFSEAESVRF